MLFVPALLALIVTMVIGVPVPLAFLVSSVVICFGNGADLSRSATLRFTVKDNFAGIAAWRLCIDGEWVPCDRFPMRGTLVHTFDTPPAGRQHDAELSVTDACGNTTRWRGTFRR